MMDELSRARIDRETDNMKVRPVDLLHAMAHDIEIGKLAVDGLLLLYANRPTNGKWNYGAYRCGLTRDQELVTVVLAQERALRSWKGE